MNKFLTKIATFGLGMIMAVGVGVAAVTSDGFTRANALTSDKSAATAIESGEKYLVTAVYNSDTYYLTPGNSALSKGNVKATKIDDISLATEDMCWVFSGSGTSWQISANGFYLANADTNNGVQTQTIAQNWTSSFSSSTLTLSGGNSRKLALYNGTNWRCYSTNSGVQSLKIYKFASNSGTLTGLQLSGEGNVKKDYEAGESFDPTNLTVYPIFDEIVDSTKNIASELTWTPNPLTVETTSVVGSYTSNSITKTIEITGLNVTAPVEPDLVISVNQNLPFNSTSRSNDQVETKVIDGINFENKGGYKYNSYLSFNRNLSGAYLRNTTPFEKNIKKVVITYENSSRSSYISVFDCISSNTNSSLVSGVTKNNDVTYNFSDTNQYFCISLSTTGTYVNISEIKIYLGSTPVVASVTGVNIDQIDHIYVGKTAQLSATVNYDIKESDDKVTWSVQSGNGVTINDSGLITAVSTDTTIIAATSVDSDANGKKVTATVSITPLENTLISVVFNTDNAKKTYYTGDSLDISNITATGTFKSGDILPLTLTTDNFSGFDSTSPNQSQLITITYQSFSATYTVVILDAPDVSLTKENFKSGSYTSNDGLNYFNEVPFEVANTFQNNGGIQMKASVGSFYNTLALGNKITRIEISVKTYNVNIHFGNSMNPSENTVNVTTEDGDFVIEPSTNYTYLTVATGSDYCVLNYVKIWFDGDLQRPDVETLSLSSTSEVLSIGETLTLDATGEPLGSTFELTWESSNNNVATVENGVVTALAGGYAIITAKVVDKDIEAECYIKVLYPDIDAGEPVGGSATVSMPIIANAGALNGESISWNSASNEITFTNNKTADSTAIRTSDATEYRIYAKSVVVINTNVDNAKLMKIVFHISGSSYVEAMKNALSDKGDVSVNGNVVTLELDGTSSTLSFSPSAQTRVTGIDVTYSSGEIQLTTLGKIEKFIDDWMMLDDPSYDGDGVGNCSSIYDDAKAAYIALGDEAHLDFVTNSHARIVAARERLSAWARANGDVLDLSTGVLSQTRYLILGVEGNNTHTTILLIVSALVIASTVFAIYYKKREENAR